MAAKYKDNDLFLFCFWTITYNVQIYEFEGIFTDHKRSFEQGNVLHLSVRPRMGGVLWCHFLL